MTEERFFCEYPKCAIYNKKMQALADLLNDFAYTEFVFNDEFTPEVLFEQLKDDVAKLNSKYGGRDIEVKMAHFCGITYTFRYNPSERACFGSLILKPVKRTINDIYSFKAE